ncbi:MAG: cytochrome c maturation protein CcmE [Solirubrobacterales bacterium]|nr:cytochrome c maturation protein CcmE [Solirubrobacterales bacterium]
MDPARKRKVRLVVALSVAVLLAVGLVYTSFSASTEARQPSELLTANPGDTYDLTGKVVPDSIDHQGEELLFRVQDRDGDQSVPVTYTGTVPDPFRDGREVIVTGSMQDGTFAGQRDTLITKCPSKFTED